jgi:radical SAM protein with 4Fe4S-binding SPASM domain
MRTTAHIDPEAHYRGSLGPIEHEDLEECPFNIRNVGWTLGNDCPYRCHHCYSMSARAKGRNLETWMVDRVVEQLAANGIETVNLGGNEPLFTNGREPRRTLLPYIIESLSQAGILVGLTTAGISLNYLAQYFPASVELLNDVDISFDSPFAEEHNRNRGAPLYNQAVRALEVAQDHCIPHSVIMCGMSWNFTHRHLRALVRLARRHGAYVRINPIKPVEPEHMLAGLTPAQYFRGFRLLMELCDVVDLGEPPLASFAGAPEAGGCPCGRSSFRIHSITPDGKVPVSPCVYLHDYKTGNLLLDSLESIIHSAQFRSFRRRNGNPHLVVGCDGCQFLLACRGGCAARGYLMHLHRTQRRTLFARDPFCLRDTLEGRSLPHGTRLRSEPRLVHRDYLCTWIGKPREIKAP